MQIRFLLQVFQRICKSHTCRNSCNNVCCGFASLCSVTLQASLFVIFFLVLFVCVCWQWRPPQTSTHQTASLQCQQQHRGLVPLGLHRSIVCHSSHLFMLLALLPFLPPSFLFLLPASFLPSCSYIFGMCNLLLIINRQERWRVLMNILQVLLKLIALWISQTGPGWTPLNKNRTWTKFLHFSGRWRLKKKKKKSCFKEICLTHLRKLRHLELSWNSKQHNRMKYLNRWRVK